MTQEPARPSEPSRPSGGQAGPPDAAAIAAEYALRATEEPLLLHQFGRPPEPDGRGRRAAFASTLRGIEVVFGGKRSGKTLSVGIPWAAAMLLGPSKRLTQAYGRRIDYLGALGCPADCVCWGVGSCGAHMCPTPERGSADFTREGCIAQSENPARPCPLHPPLQWAEARTRLVLIGCLDLARFWNVLYGEGLKKLLARDAKGRPLWREDHGMQRVVALDGSYIAQAVPYDDLARAESWDPVGVLLDEFPQEPMFRSMRYRLLSSNGKMLITGTPIDLLQGRGLWVTRAVEQRKGIVGERIQTFKLATRDNVFLGDAALARVREEEAQMRERDEQEWLVCFCGEPVAAQSQAYFPKATLDRVARDVRRGERAWPVLPKLITEIPRIVYERPGPDVESYELELWLRPVEGHVYSIGADTAKGVIGGDYSVVELFDVTAGEQAAEFRAQAPPEALEAVVYALMQVYKQFGRGGIVVEENGYGRDVLHRLINERGVPRGPIFHRWDQADRTLSGQSIAQAGFWTGRGSRNGVSTLEDPKGDIPSPLGSLKAMLADGTLRLHSQRLLEEMQVFVRNAGRLEAIEGAHDDMVVAAALAALGFHMAVRSAPAAKPAPEPVRKRDGARAGDHRAEMNAEERDAPSAPARWYPGLTDSARWNPVGGR